MAHRATGIRNATITNYINTPPPPPFTAATTTPPTVRRRWARRWWVVLPTATVTSVAAASALFSYFEVMPWARVSRPLDGPPPVRQTALYVTGREQTTIYDLSSRPKWMLRLATLRRAIFLVVCVALPLLLRYAVAFSPWLGSGERVTAAHKAAGKRLASLGPTYVKLGQWLAMRGDVIPAELSSLLTPLLNNSPTHSWGDSQRILSSAGILEKFSSVVEIPLGSGTIAQVHVAVLKEDYFNTMEFQGEKPVVFIPRGTEILLKIRHPGGQEHMLTDLMVMMWGAHFTQMFIPSLRFLWPEQSITEFSAMLLSQMDLMREADNLAAFQYFFQHDPHVVFPTPLMDFCSEEVLVETFEFGQRIPSLGTLEHGIKEDQIDDVEELEAISHPISPTLGPVATNMFLRMLFEFNMIHSDLHPGNVLHRYKLLDGVGCGGKEGSSSRSRLAGENMKEGITFSMTDPSIPNHDADDDVTVNTSSSSAASTSPTGVRLVVPQLVILDPGLVTSLTDTDRHHVFMLMTAILCADGPLAAKLLLERAASIGSYIDPNLLPSFQAEMQVVVEGFKPNALSMKETQITELIGAAMQAMRHHSVRVDMNFASLLETLALGDACARVIAPKQNIFHDSAPFLWKFLKVQELESLAATVVTIYLPNSGMETARQNFKGLFVGMGQRSLEWFSNSTP